MACKFGIELLDSGNSLEFDGLECVLSLSVVGHLVSPFFLDRYVNDTLMDPQCFGGISANRKIGFSCCGLKQLKH